VRIKTGLIPAIERLADALDAKASAFHDIIKIGRTHLQDATPNRLGQEFSGYAAQMRIGVERLHGALDGLCELALGGTAVGTGINTHPEFGARVAAELAKRTGVNFKEARNHFEAQHAKDAVVDASGRIRTVAISLSKIANDIRLMGCGPRCGIGELKVPAVQPGSSIMPGKVNPVICESAIMVSCQVIGNDAAIAAGNMGGVGSVLDLNVAMPMMADNLMSSIHLMERTAHMFVDNLLEGLQADEARCAELIEGSLAMCTSLVPVIGYDRSAALAKQAYAEGKTVRELALEQKLLPAEDLARLLDPTSMTRSGE
jgi:fumarate hydratase class II